MTPRPSSLSRLTILVLCVSGTALLGCGKKAAPSSPAKPPQAPRSTGEAAPAPADVRPDVADPAGESRGSLAPLPVEGEAGPAAAYARLKALVEGGERAQVRRYVTKRSKRHLRELDDEALARLFEGGPGEVRLNGGRAVLELTGEPELRYAVFLWRQRGWRYDLGDSLKYEPWRRRPEVAENHMPSLAEALDGVEGTGPLRATLQLTVGTIRCTLFEDLAPVTVANFVALARGRRAFRPPGSREWVKRPFYDGLILHRCTPGFGIQTGDPLGTGTGGPGYTIPDEFDRRARHSRPGVLSMANAGPNSAGSQFFLTERSTPWLDDRHAVFGACEPIKLIASINRMDKRPGSHRPVVDVRIRSIRVFRGEDEGAPGP